MAFSNLATFINPNIPNFSKRIFTIDMLPAGAFQNFINGLNQH